jgi:bifunctional non-homologous end joining protein LigD
MNLLQPMEPIPSSMVTTEKGWIHQVKWDGIRGISYIEKNSLRVFTKKGRERTDFYPEVKQCLRLLKVKQAILDGELVVLGDSGVPSFNRVLTRERIRTLTKLAYYSRNYPVNYIIFDLLYLNNQDLRGLPLSERSSILRDILKPDEHIFLTDDYLDGQKLYEMMKERSMEGIVSKRLSSLYQGGKKHNDWLKIKINRKMLTVIGGIILKNNYPNSLLLGIYNDENLVYVGRASLGLSQANILDLYNHITKYKTNTTQEKSPFIDATNESKTVWLRPALTCWVQFLEWTEGGVLRHPKIIGFSEQNPKEAVGKEYII